MLQQPRDFGLMKGLLPAGHCGELPRVHVARPAMRAAPTGSKSPDCGRQDTGAPGPVWFLVCLCIVLGNHSLFGITSGKHSMFGVTVLVQALMTSFCRCPHLRRWTSFSSGWLQQENLWVQVGAHRWCCFFSSALPGHL